MTLSLRGGPSSFGGFHLLLLLLLASVGNAKLISYDDRGVIANEQFVHDIQVADMDGDGDLDVLVGTDNKRPGHFVLSRNNGGIYDTEQVLVGEPQDSPNLFRNDFRVSSIAVGDFDGDGSPDVAVGNDEYNNAVVALALSSNSGAGTFNTTTLVPTDSFQGLTQVECTAVKAADVDQDGDTDLVAVIQNTDETEGLLVFFENEETGSFATNVVASNLNGPAKIQLADMDNDGDLDIVVLAVKRNIVWIFENDGSGSFTPVVVDATAPDAAALAVSDLNGSGDMDILIGKRNIVVYANDGGGSFQEGVEIWNVENEPVNCNLSFWCNIDQIAVMDADGDGRLDILFSVISFRDLNVLYQPEPNLFESRMETIVEAPSSHSFQTADLNQDGLTDIVVNAGNDFKVYYYLAKEVPTNPPTLKPALPDAPQMPETADPVSKTKSGKDESASDATSVVSTIVFSWAVVLWCAAKLVLL